MSTKKIMVNGCDDSTGIEMEMTDEQFQFLREFAGKINAVGEHVHCKPSIRLEGDENFYFSPN